MKKENIFYLIFILAILVMRVGLFLFPQNKLVLGTMRINHFWVGIFLVLLILCLPKIYMKLRIVLFSIGLGLIADELTFMLIGEKTLSNYWSTYSISGLVIIIIIVFVFRRSLIDKI